MNAAAPVARVSAHPPRKENAMLAIKKARKLIEAQPTDADSKILAALVLALESESHFQLSDLYKMDYKRFEIALDILAEWRIDRYYASKLRLIDASVQVAELTQASTTSPEATV